MKIIFVFIFLIGFSPISGLAADWQFIAENQDNKIFVDKESITYHSDFAVRAVFNTVTKMPFKIFEKYLLSQIAYEEQNCKEHKFRFLQVTGYHDDGTTEPVISEPSAWIDVAFGKIFTEKHKYLCKNSRE